MALRTKLVVTFASLGLALTPSGVAAQDFAKERGELSTSPEARQSPANELGTTFAMVLTDHPGRATALTDQQMAEIRGIVSKSDVNSHLVCAGVSLSGQRESMYRVVRLRAQLVCDYAQALEPSFKTTVLESFTPSDRYNGRVVVVSRLPDSNPKPSSNWLRKH